MKKCLILVFALATQWAIAQETQIKGFVDTQYGVVHADSLKDKDNNRGFQVGQFDLFITSQINDRTSFLGETVFEWDSEEQKWVLDVERVIIKYSVKDYLNISGGKFHTPFGYWNNAYHHGALIQPTINRPVIVRFEDNGGYLPIHQVGAQVSGAGIGARNFGYSVFLSNGQAQGNSGGSFSYGVDAISGSVSMEPVEDLQFIASAYTSRVPKNTVTYQGIVLDHESRYTLLNAAVTYFHPSAPVEFATEYFNISNSMAESHTTNAFYAYFGVRLVKNFVPYVLFNKVNFENGERYFLKNNVDEITMGARYNLATKVVVKLEYTSSQSEAAGKASLIQTQIAIGF
jgi:hypothetical protein